MAPDELCRFVPNVKKGRYKYGCIRGRALARRASADGYIGPGDDSPLVSSGGIQCHATIGDINALITLYFAAVPYRRPIVVGGVEVPVSLIE